MSILEFHPKHGIGQRLNHDSFDFNRFFLGHTTFPDNPLVFGKPAEIAISPFQILSS